MAGGSTPNPPFLWASGTQSNTMCFGPHKFTCQIACKPVERFKQGGRGTFLCALLYTMVVVNALRMCVRLFSGAKELVAGAVWDGTKASKYRRRGWSGRRRSALVGGRPVIACPGRRVHRRCLVSALTQQRAGRPGGGPRHRQPQHEANASAAVWSTTNYMMCLRLVLNSAPR